MSLINPEELRIYHSVLLNLEHLSESHIRHLISALQLELELRGK